MSFNEVAGVSDSWSLKYNLLWQRLLGLDGPFDWDKVVSAEIAYYISKANAFGTPMDPRHSYVKTDWLSWAAAMTSNDADFHTIMQVSVRCTPPRSAPPPRRSVPHCPSRHAGCMLPRVQGPNLQVCE